MQGSSWHKPHGDDLIPDFIRDTGVFEALAIYFGIPALKLFFLMEGTRLNFSGVLASYRIVLSMILGELSLFYAVQLLPALILRSLICRKSFTAKDAFGVSLLLSILAVFVFYPLKQLLVPVFWKQIYIYVAIYPMLITFCTLRIKRIRWGALVVAAVFLGQICWGVISGVK